jgi:hypothetical protein
MKAPARAFLIGRGMGREPGYKMDLKGEEGREIMEADERKKGGIFSFFLSFFFVFVFFPFLFLLLLFLTFVFQI